MNMEFVQVRNQIQYALEQLLESQIHIMPDMIQSGNSYLANSAWVPDLQLQSDNLDIIIEYKAKASSEAVSAAIRHIRAFKAEHSNERLLLLLVVPYMWEIGQRMCREEGISWIDLSGNAWVWEQGFQISVQGYPNTYKQKGRPSNLFAPKSSRVVRVLIESYPQEIMQKDLPYLTGLGKGYISSILSRLTDGLFIRKQKHGVISVLDPNSLLDAWRERYEFSKQRMIKGHMHGRTSQEILRSLSQTLTEKNMIHAATGLASAWMHIQFAGFRLSTIYISDFLNDHEWNDIGIRLEERGSNVWLVQPTDDFVFNGCTTIDHIPCVTPLQTYLDLKGQPERSEEAAEELRNRKLAWSA